MRPSTSWFAAPVLAMALQTLYLASVVSPTKDLAQDWAMSRAVLVGRTPYAPMAQMGALLQEPAIVGSRLPLPSNHPPGGWLVPLGLVSFPTASLLWLAAELAMLGWLTRGRLLPWALLLAWTPVQSDLVLGQLSLPVACLLLAHVRGNRWALGAALALKLAGWPLLLYAPGKALRPLLLGGALTGAALLLTGAPLETLSDYLVVLRDSQVYGTHPWNIAPAALVERLTGSHSLGLLALLGWVVGALVLARRLKRHGTLLVLTLGCVASPIAWDHVLVLCIPAMLVSLESPRARGLVVLGIVLAQGHPILWTALALLCWPTAALFLSWKLLLSVCCFGAALVVADRDHATSPPFV